MPSGDKKVLGIVIILSMIGIAGAYTVDNIIANTGLFYNNVTIGNGSNTITFNGTSGRIATIGNIEALGNVTALGFYTFGGEVTGLLTVTSNTTVDAFKIDNNNVLTVTANDNGNITATGNITGDNFYGTSAIMHGQRSEFHAGNGKIVTTNSGGSAQFNGDTKGGAIDFAGNTASIGISADGVSNNYDYDGAFIFKQKASNPDEIGEFIFIEESGDWRFALPSSGADYGTYNPRSMIIAGASVDNASNFKCSYWGFDNLDCNTAGTGADLGVQDDLQVLDEIHADQITLTETGTETGITIDHDTNISGFDFATRRFIHLDYDSIGYGAGEGRGGTTTGLDIDFDYTGSAGIVDQPSPRPIDIDVTLAPDSQTNMQYLTIDSTGGRASAPDGVIFVNARGNSSSLTTAAKTQATNAGSGGAKGYYGWAQAQANDQGSGSLTGVEGYTIAYNGTSKVMGLVSNPKPGVGDYSLLDDWDIIGLYAGAGTVYIRDGNLIAWNNSGGGSTPEAVTTDNLDLQNITGQGYFASDIEVDGYAYLDGGHGDIAETYHTAYSQSMMQTVTTGYWDEQEFPFIDENGTIQIEKRKIYVSSTKEVLSNNFIPEFTGGEQVCLTINGLIKECDRFFDNYFIGIISEKPNLIITHHKHGYPVAELGIVRTNADCNKNWQYGQSVYAGNQELLTLDDAQSFPLNWENFDRMQGARIGRIAGECQNGKVPVFID